MRVSKTSILYAILEAHGTDFVLVDEFCAYYIHVKTGAAVNSHR
jgi:hypothetical protein